MIFLKKKVVTFSFGERYTRIKAFKAIEFKINFIYVD